MSQNISLQTQLCLDEFKMDRNCCKFSKNTWGENSLYTVTITNALDVTYLSSKV